MPGTPENIKRKTKMILEQMDIGEVYQNYTPHAYEFPIELMEHICLMNDVLLTDDIINVMKSVYAETKYRVMLEITEKLKGL